MLNEALILALALIGVITGFLALWFAIEAKIQVEAQRRSTHTVQMVPVDSLGGIKTDDDGSRDKAKQEAGIKGDEIDDYFAEL